MIHYLPEFLTVAGIHLLAVMGPGPDFALTIKNTLVHSRKADIFTAIGFALGVLIHVAYSLVGIGFIISQSIVLFSTIKLLGAGYLIYIGYKSLKAKKAVSMSEASEAHQELSRSAAIRMGFLTNILNPKVTLFIFSLFTQVIHPTTPKLIQALYGVEMALMTIAWFSLVATMLSHKLIKQRFVKIQHWVERTMGVVLIALGIKVALSSSK